MTIHATADDILPAGAPTSPTPRRHLFLDVDGVLNPDTSMLSGDWRPQEIGEFLIWTSVSLGRWLGELLADGVQIVWATTWINAPADLDEVAFAFGLPANLPRIDRLEYPTAESWLDCGKRPGIERWLDGHGVDPRFNPVAWADDCLGPGDLRWARRRGVHAIDVPASTGLDDPAQRLRIECALAIPSN